MSAKRKRSAVNGTNDDEAVAEDSSLSVNDMDILTIDVGGEGIIRVFRHTLTQFEGSLLAAKFSGRWKNETTAEGHIFMNQPIELFKPLVDFLRRNENETPGFQTNPPSTETFRNIEAFGFFLHMVENYGLTEFMYPFWIVPISQFASNRPFPFVPSGVRFDHVNGRGDYYIKTINPKRTIESFELQFLSEVRPGEASGDERCVFTMGFIGKGNLPLTPLPSHQSYDGALYIATRIPIGFGMILDLEGVSFSYLGGARGTVIATEKILFPVVN